MRSIKRRFDVVQAKNSGWSSYICFAEAIRGQGFTREGLHRWFNKLVDPEDYSPSDKRAILNSLEQLNTHPGTPVLGVNLLSDEQNAV